MQNEQYRVSNTLLDYIAMLLFLHLVLISQVHQCLALFLRRSDTTAPNPKRQIQKKRKKKSFSIEHLSKVRQRVCMCMCVREIVREKQTKNIIYLLQIRDKTKTKN
jgi:hypothetical protein